MSLLRANAFPARTGLTVAQAIQDYTVEIHSALIERARRRAVRLHRRARTQLLGDEPLEAHELLLTEAARVAAVDRTLAVGMSVDASIAAWIGADRSAALAAARQAKRFARGAGERANAAADLFVGLTLVTDDPGRGGHLVRKALRRLPQAAAELKHVSLLGFALMWLDDYRGSRAVLEAAVDHARTTGDDVLSGALDTLALLDFRTGRWSSAEARSTEALRLATERRQTAQVASCLTTLARIAAARGQEPECRRLVEDALRLARHAVNARAYAATAVALLEIGGGRSEAALEQLARVSPEDEPSLFEWRADLVEAYVRCGRAADAATALARLERDARATRRRSALAVVARCRGLVASTADFDGWFAQALRLHATVPVPFERARTELCFGERLRRARRRAEARAPLRSALATFTELGAVPWAERAQRELAATGRRGRSGQSAFDPLTERELRVASLVQRGVRNREIATELFVKERTVEYHLTNIYDKLHVRSRTELTHLLMSERR